MIIVGCFVSLQGMSQTVPRKVGNDYFEGIKARGDSMLIENFGLNFFKAHIKFSESSEINFDRADNLKDWKWNERDKVSSKPDYIFLDYFIVLDEMNVYQTITLTVDSNGNKFKDGSFTGIEKCDPHCEFKVDIKDIKSIARKNGVPFKKNRSQINLKWISPDSLNLAKGNFIGKHEIQLATMVGTKEVQTSGSYSRYGLYEVAIINPWTGKFVRKTQMTGLISGGRKFNPR